jgi:molecular chaperone DnaK (HSP70)
MSPGSRLAAMRLGIDLGTTRTVVAACDRGNYPVVGFVTPTGDVLEHYPTVSADVGGALVHGFEAEGVAQAGAPSLRSWKRLLSEHGTGTVMQVGSVRLSLLELVTDFLAALRRDLTSRSNVAQLLPAQPEVVIAVPANAHSTQRFVTLEAFRRAGFRVRAMMNEPSAAGIEYAQRHGRTITSRREHIVVYDLGGGTFDAALVSMAGDQHDVLFTSGVSRLGGDDFDEALLDLGLERAQIDPTTLSPLNRAALLLECRAAKEGMHPNTRRIALDFAGLGSEAPPTSVVVAASDYYDRARHLVERTIEALEPVLQRAAREEAGVVAEEAAVSLPEQGAGGALPAATSLAGIYVVGGSSGLPLVGRVLRESFGRRVHRSVHPSAATAIGLAIAACVERAPKVTERFTRHLGVFREQDSGNLVSFDSIFALGTPLPKPGEPPLVFTRSYNAAHNVGLFRYVECSALGPNDEPSGDVTPHGTIRFPFVATAREGVSLEEVSVERLPTLGPLIEERYEVDSGGVVVVTISDQDAGHQRRFAL